MTPDELQTTLDVLGWSKRGLAAFLVADDRLIRRWGTDERSIPPDVATWLRKLAAAHRANPAPEGWRRRMA